MDFISNLLITALQQAGLSLLHNWPYLLVGILISALVKTYVDAEKVSAFLKRFQSLGVMAATAAAVGTPLCSCGTTAVILGMMANTMPWAPIVAFMVASPLTSPEGLFYSAGLFGWPFALAFFAASILLGLAGGVIAAVLENQGWLANQTRIIAQTAPQLAPACACSEQPVQVNELSLIRLESLQPVSACACSTPAEAVAVPISYPGRGALSGTTAVKAAAGVNPFLRELIASGKQFLPMFLGFAFIGYLLNGLIPASWVSAIFGGGNIYSVPLAATLAIPLYINSEGSLPLIRAMLDNGMSQGAALAFLITGSGTSIGAIGGALTIARWRVVGLVIAILWVGAILAGYAYDQMVTLNLF